AFNLDLNVISNVCDLYAADGLYVLDSTVHSPLIGFAYDGFPVYGAFGFTNTNGTGGITRMTSGYQLRNITVRTHYANGTDVTDGPAVSATYPLGYFREDYEFVASTDPDRLDEHNGRFCVTPEYPAGTYAYFCTVDENWNSAYPYIVGPTFYGTKVASRVNSITEPTTIYTPSTTELTNLVTDEASISIYPNPASDVVAVQLKSFLNADCPVVLFDAQGRIVERKILPQGSTIAYFDTRRLYAGEYLVLIGNVSRRVVLVKD
ncbi:MAG: YHYH protein, partial [Bacteroidota bacterium]